ncbi:hypothetical protein [Uliginosibacterium flavum]|uniref:Uncharacterized protein n=1 Tax=Uliginosibacterium flavum TaxID=1396831 RepID=A0ABV2TML3_9RHOO
MNTSLSHDSIHLRLQNDLQGLSHIQSFGWLRASELGQFMFAHTKYPRQAAERMVRGWLERKLIIERPLPSIAGRALVLSEAGARLLRQHGSETAKTNKDWGRFDGGLWHPDQQWEHDLMAAGILAKLSGDFRSEREVIATATARGVDLKKIPDGLICIDDTWLALEVENASKTGKDMAHLAHGIAWFCSGTVPALGDIQIKGAVIALDKHALDARGCRINHMARVTSALENIISSSVDVKFLIFERQGFSVSNFVILNVTIESVSGARIRNFLDRNNAWNLDSGYELWEATYMDVRATVWFAADNGECWWVNIEPNDQCRYEINTIAYPVESADAGKMKACELLSKVKWK